MKLYNTLFLIFILAYSQTSFSGSIQDDFANGDTLTAQHLNNIKQAINDNQIQVIDNTQAIILDAEAADHNAIEIVNVSNSASQNAKDIIGNSKNISVLNFSLLSLQPNLAGNACDGYSYVQGFNASGEVVCSTDLLGTGYSRRAPQYQDNLVSVEIDGVLVNFPMLVISGL